MFNPNVLFKKNDGVTSTRTSGRTPAATGLLCLLARALLLAHTRALLALLLALLQACACSPTRTALWGPPALASPPHETLVTWWTHYNIRLKQMEHLEHTLATYVCSHCTICNI